MRRPSPPRRPCGRSTRTSDAAHASTTSREGDACVAPTKAGRTSPRREAGEGGVGDAGQRRVLLLRGGEQRARGGAVGGSEELDAREEVRRRALLDRALERPEGIGGERLEALLEDAQRGALDRDRVEELGVADPELHRPERARERQHAEALV